MAPSSMRRLSTVLLAAFLGVAVASSSPAGAASPGRGGSPTLAQTEAGVSLRLVSESPWTAANQPLQITFQATNGTTAAIGGLSVELSIETPARSRSLYELSLTSDAYTPLLVAYPFAQEGTVQPGETRRFTVEQPLDLLAARGESALYPIKVELRSQDVTVATLRSPMVFLTERPEVPLNLAWTWVLSEPLQYGPDGTFLPGTIETDIAKGGRLRAMADALRLLPTKQVDVVVSSVLVDQLQRMAAGYRIRELGGNIRQVAAGTGGAADATAMLRILKRVAASERTELLATPFGDPSLPALFRAGLAAEEKPLVDRGVALVGDALGRQPTKDVVRPYRSQLDAATLPRLDAAGARTVLLNPGFVPAAKFESPDVLRLTSGSSSVAGIMPNPELATLVASYRDDPVLAAHVGLGELAAIWLELPGTPARGAAVLFGEDPGLPPAFFRPFADLVRHSSWLQPITATGFVSIIAAAQSREVPPRSFPGFPFAYVRELIHAQASLGRFRQTTDGATAVESRLRDNLQLATSSAFVTDPAHGLAFIATVGVTIRQTYDQVHLDTSPVTLASKAGLLPLVVTNDSDQTLRVVLRMVTDRRLEFTGGSTKPVVLAPGTRTITISVRAQATGRIPVKVQVLSSGNAPDLVAERTMVVRSTAYNRVALIVTIGAAAFLLGWWGRRFLPRRRS
jgi:Family of unknown function (DUF6049)